MALIDIVIPYEEVPVSEGQVLKLRGITFEDLDFLMSKNAKELNALAAMLASAIDDTAEQADKTASATMASMQVTRPTLASQIIACASGDYSEEAIGRARLLPLPVSMEALTVISKLTFEVNGGIKKFVELLMGTIMLLQKMSQTDPVLSNNTGTTG